MKLEFAVCIDGVAVTREGVEAWPEPDALRREALDALAVAGRDALSWDHADGGFAVGPLWAAARLKRADPDALVTICVWPAE